MLVCYFQLTAMGRGVAKSCKRVKGLRNTPPWSRISKACQKFQMDHPPFPRDSASDSCQYRATTSQTTTTSLASADAAGEVLICMHNKSSPLLDVPLMVNPTLWSGVGKEAESWMSIGMLTGPAACGHFKPFQVRVPVPSGREILFGGYSPSARIRPN